MKEKLSVIMPIYNGSKFMKKTIEQIKAQTFSNFICYLIDDCSKDDSVDIIKKEIKDDRRFILIENKKNLGKPKTLNKGLSLVNGDYVLMLDDDDEYMPTMFEKLYNKAIESDLDITVCNLLHFDIEQGRYSNKILDFSKIDESSTYNIKTLPEDILPLKLFYSVVWNKLFKLDFIKKNNLKFENFFPADDTLFTLKAICAAKSIGIIKETLIAWKVNDPESGMGSLSRNDGYKNIVKMFYEMEKCLRSNKVWGRYKDTYYTYPIEFAFGQLTTSMKNSNVVEDFFNKTKDYTNSIKNEIKKEDPLIVRAFLESKSFPEFMERYDSSAVLIEAKNIIAYNESKIEDLENQLTTIKNSRSYKLGRILSAPLKIFKKN